jgi:hypothetical protein
MKNEYVFLREDGTVKSTLKTDGEIPTSDTVLKVSDSDSYIGKIKIGEEFVEMSAEEPLPVDPTTMTDVEFRELVLDKLGIPVVKDKSK